MRSHARRGGASRWIRPRVWRRATHLSMAARSSGSHCDGASDILEVVSEAAMLMAPRAVLNVPVVEDGATPAPPRGTPSHLARVSLALRMATPDGGRLAAAHPEVPTRANLGRSDHGGASCVRQDANSSAFLRPRLHTLFRNSNLGTKFCHSRARIPTPLTSRLFRKPLVKMVRDIDVSCPSSASPAVSVHPVWVTALLADTLRSLLFRPRLCR